MKLIYLVPLLLTCAPALAAPACTTATLDGLQISGAWTRATIGTDRPAVLYLSIRNDGTDDSLTAISTPMAGSAMLHETIVQDGTAQMRHVAAVPVRAKGTAKLAPGGLHGMLMQLSGPLVQGKTLPVTLTFAKAGSVEVSADILPLNAQKSQCSAADS